MNAPLCCLQREKQALAEQAAKSAHAADSAATAAQGAANAAAAAAKNQGDVDIAKDVYAVPATPAGLTPMQARLACPRRMHV